MAELSKSNDCKYRHLAWLKHVSCKELARVTIVQLPISHQLLAGEESSGSNSKMHHACMEIGKHLITIELYSFHLLVIKLTEKKQSIHIWLNTVMPRPLLESIKIQWFDCSWSELCVKCTLNLPLYCGSYGGGC